MTKADSMGNPNPEVTIGMFSVMQIVDIYNWVITTCVKVTHEINSTPTD